MSLSQGLADLLPVIPHSLPFGFCACCTRDASHIGGKNTVLQAVWCVHVALDQNSIKVLFRSTLPNKVPSPLKVCFCVESL